MFSTQSWLVDNAILQNIDYAGYPENLRKVQARHLNSVLSADRIGRLLDAETTNKTFYSALEMLSDLRKGIWKEAYVGKSADIYRRNLQRTYLERMETLLNAQNSSRSDFNITTSDISALVRGELKTLRSKLKVAKNGSINTVTRYHYEDAIAKIEQALEPK